MKRPKKFLFLFAATLLFLIALFCVAALIYMFTGSEKTRSHQSSSAFSELGSSLFPARAYPENFQACMNAGGFEDTYAFGAQKVCTFESHIKYQPWLLRCPKEGRIFKQDWCGDFPCPHPRYSCILEFPVPQDESQNSKNTQQSMNAPKYVRHSPEDVFALAKQLDSTVEIDTFYEMSDWELYFEYGRYLSQQQQLPYQQGYLFLSYPSEADLGFRLDVEKKLRDAGIETYNPKGKFEQPGLGYNFDFYYQIAKQSGIRMPFNTVRVRSASTNKEAIEKLGNKLFSRIHCTDISQNAEGSVEEFDMECVYGDMSTEEVTQILVDVGIVDYTFIHYLSILVPYGEEEYWGETLQEWDEIEGYELVD